MDLAAYRDLFPIVRHQAFFNHAGIAPLATPVAETVAEFYRECAEQAGAGYSHWQRRLAAARQSAASLLGATSTEIAFTGNTSTGLALIAESFPWRPGDAVLVPVPDFPANVYPWQHLERRGVEVRFVERQQGRLTPAIIATALRPHVRLLALSSVDYASGYAADLPAISDLCRKNGVLLAVDAIQSLGVLPIDVRSAGIQLLAAGGHKWLCGPLGSGLLYVAADLPVQLTPVLVGWKSVVEPEDFRLHFDLTAPMLPASSRGRSIMAESSASGGPSSCCWRWESNGCGSRSLPWWIYWRRGCRSAGWRSPPRWNRVNARASSASNRKGMPRRPSEVCWIDR